MSSPALSVVVVHHRGLERLLECLDGVAAAGSRVPGCQTIVVDNTGAGDLAGPLRGRPSVRHVKAPRNVGFARGCRLGAEASQSPLVVFVNDDAILEPDALERLAATLAAAPPDVSAVAGSLTDLSGERNDFSDGFLTFDGHAFQQDVGRPVKDLPPSEPGDERLFACGGLMAVRRDAFFATGGFDDDYFAYLEDVDFGWRQWIFGRRVLAEPRARARHHGGATGQALGIFSRGFLIERNAFATAYKNFDREHFAALMPAVLEAFVTRLAEMLSTRNPAASELVRDPYAPEPGSALAATIFGIRREAGRTASVIDPLTLAQTRALVWIHRHRASLAEKRRTVQAGRRRPDAEIFRKFPLRIVPTYPGDEGFESDFFRAFLSAAPPLMRSSLEEIFGRGA
jgi:GT2 family glycosyltransferase